MSIVNIKRILLSFLLVGVGINLGQFIYIDEKLNDNYKALNISDSSYITEIGTKKSAAIRGYYLPWITLSKVVPNSHVIVPSNWSEPGLRNLYDLATLSRLRGFGGISSLSRTHVPKFDPAELINNSNECVVATGEDTREDMPYFAIVLEVQGECPVRITAAQSGLTVSSKVPVEVGSTLVLVPWEGPRKPYHPNGSSRSRSRNSSKRKADYYVVLIEASLLPDRIQREIKQ